MEHSRFSMRISGASIFDGHLESHAEPGTTPSMASSFVSRFGWGGLDGRVVDDDGDAGTISMAAVPRLPGTYRVQIFLKLFNYPNHVCDSEAEHSTGKYIDKIITNGDFNITVSSAKSGASSNSFSSSSSLRLCGVGDYHDLRGEWNRMPIYRETHAKFTPFKDCRLPDYPDVAKLTEAAITQKKRKWLRLLGDSNTRYLFMADPLVPLDEEMQWHWPRIMFPDKDKMRSKCVWGLDPAAKDLNRNLRTTRKVCRVGLADGHPQDDFAISWEFYTPIHPPLLTEYIETTEPNAFFVNHTIAGLFANLTWPANWNNLTVNELFADRPDILHVENPDHLFLSYGSHANTHTRDNIDEDVDTLETLLGIFERRHKQNPASEALPGLTVGLITPKTCRKFDEDPVSCGEDSFPVSRSPFRKVPYSLALAMSQLSDDLYRVCNSVTVQDRNAVLMEVLSQRGLLGPDGRSLHPDSSSLSSSTSPSPSSVYPNINILDFWHTTESIEDAMPDKVHFQWAVYNLHATLVMASVYGAELVDRSAYESFDVYGI